MAYHEKTVIKLEINLYILEQRNNLCWVILHVKINIHFSPLESQCANLLKIKTGFIKPVVSC